MLYMLLQNNKEIYRTFLNYRVSDPYLKTYWNDLLNINDINWNHVYKRVNHLYNNRFRYKLLNNIINTNENLYKWRIITSPCCCCCYCKERT